MPRRPRLILPDLPHHVTQRGTRRQQTFFSPADYITYKELLADWCGREKIELWAYCLMPNHIHLVVVPRTVDGLSRMMGQVHRRYARIINKREDWTGHLWQERYFSCLMDEAHTLAAIRYVEQNPIRSNLVTSAGAWQWSSARAHLDLGFDKLLSPFPLQDRIQDWPGFLSVEPSQDQLRTLRRHTEKGYPAGSSDFISSLRLRFGCEIGHNARGRPRSIG